MSTKDPVFIADENVNYPDTQSIETPRISGDNNRLQELEKQLAELNCAFDQAEQMVNLGSWRWKLTTNTVIFSDGLYKLLGCEPGEFDHDADNFRRFIHPDDKNIMITRQQALDNNFPAVSEFRIIAKNGDLRYLKSFNKLLVREGEKVIFGTTQDVTEEYKLRRRLEEKISLVESVIENSVDLIAAYDMNLRCIVWNKACEVCFKKKKEDVLCRHVTDIFPELKGFQCMNDLDMALTGEYRYRSDQVLSNVEGLYEYYIVPLKNMNGEVFGAVSISHDLKMIKQSSDKLNELNQTLEQKNRELERSNDELASFSYIASHDLQEPLRKIQTFSKIIMEKEFTGLSARGKDYLKRMESGASRMQALIDDLLTFSRTTTYPKDFAPSDLNILLEEVKAGLKDSIDDKNAVIEWNRLPVINVIAFQFRQLMENLIINSIKYSKPGKQPHVFVNYETVPASEVNNSAAAASQTYHKISVSDQGIGFEQEYSQKIFELFQRLHGKEEYPGTGLGLAICKKIVENHHGFISAHGKLGEGATFVIYLP